MRRTPGLLGPLIGLFSPTTTGQLVRREGGFSPVVVPEPRPRTEMADDLWLGLFAGEAPERRRVGVTHLSEGPQARGGIDGDALPEVHVDGAWRWMDPPLGQRTADATHIELLNGGIESWTGILLTSRALAREVLEVHGPPGAATRSEEAGSRAATFASGAGG